MNFQPVEGIANSVLYEGYILYPYRPSSTKNRQRWNFGTLYPQAFAEAQRPPESFSMTTECLALASPGATIDLRVRFLQLLQPASEAAAAQPGSSWEEGVERAVDHQAILLSELVEHPTVLESAIDPPPSHLHAMPLLLRLHLHATQFQDALFRLRIVLTNTTPMPHATQCPRESALRYSFSSAHVLLGIIGGQFISLLDPPEEYCAAVADCHNVGAFPVLVGSETGRNMLLSAPIILYDFPQIAPESPGDFFDGTEMDEMLSLRVLTLTDEEKQEMRHSDSRARAILDRTETLPPEQLMKVHGAIRGLRRVQQEREDEP